MEKEIHTGSANSISNSTVVRSYMLKLYGEAISIVTTCMYVCMYVCIYIYIYII